MQIIILTKNISESQIKDIQKLILQLDPTYPPVITEAYINSLIDMKGNVIFCALGADRTVGILVLSVLHAISGNKAWVEDLVVDKDFRGKGISKQLLEACISHAKANQITHLNLTTKDTRIEANKLYKTFGFEINDTNYYRLKLI